MDSVVYDAILCDIGGVLYVGDTPIEGAIDAVARMKECYSVRFLTNTTQKTGSQVVETLQKMGFPIAPEEVMTALDMTHQFLERQKSGACFLLTEEAKAFFSDLPTDPCRYVVIGDAQENFSFEHLNEAFRTLLGGAELLAAAKNRYFRDADGMLSMDAGGFVAALEYASGKEARLFGKPSRDFFTLACESMGSRPEATLMIGDDIESDIAGARDAGLKTVLVKTGKFTPEDLQKGIVPDMILESIADIL